MTHGDTELLRSALAYERSMVRLCMADLDGGCASDADADASREWLTYRQLVRARLRETLEHGFERLHGRLGERQFGRLREEFLHATGPSRTLLRHLPEDFLERLARRLDDGELTDLPPWTMDLARFEWAELEVAYAPDDVAAHDPLSMDRPLAITASCRLLRLGHRVHELPREDHPQPVAPGMTAICLYRDRSSFDVRVLELSEPAACLLEEVLAGGLPLSECARRAAERSGSAIDATWLAAFATMLTDWTARGIALGVRDL